MSKLEGKVAIVTGAPGNWAPLSPDTLPRLARSVVVKLFVEQGGADASSTRSRLKGGQGDRVKANVPGNRRSITSSPRPKKGVGRLTSWSTNAGIYQFAPLEGVTEDLPRHVHLNAWA